MSETESFFSSATDRDDYIKNAVPVYKQVINWALSSVSGRKPKRIVDIGCGLGHSTQLLNKHFGKSKIVGLDICPHAIAERIFNNDSIELNVGNVESLLKNRKLQSESFDFAFTSFFSSEFGGDDEYEYFEPLVADLQDLMKSGGTGLFVHNGPDCEDFLIGLGYDVDTPETNKVLRPKRAEWKLFDCTEYGFVEFQLTPNDFYT